MDLIEVFKKIKEGEEFYSPLYGKIIFQQVRVFNPLQSESPQILEFKTVANNIVLFNNEGKPIIFHPSGEMIFETNLGECLIYDITRKIRIDILINDIVKQINLES